MPRRQIDFHVGEYYHVYNRGANREPIFLERENYEFFLRRFHEKIPPEHVTLLAYCLMPNHYHLLVRLESEAFSARMHAFGTSYTKTINGMSGRIGTLFQGRFRAKRVDSESCLAQLSRYIHLNPVVAQLVQQPADWEFSSYLEYLGTRQGTPPNPELVLREFASREAYRTFVETPPPASDASIAHLVFDE